MPRAKAPSSEPGVQQSAASGGVARDLIEGRRHLRKLLLDGARSSPTRLIDESYFDELRRRARQAG